MDTPAKKALFEFIISKLNLSPHREYSLLDFGCGTGDFLGLVSRSAGVKSRLLGIDGDEGFIREAKRGYPGFEFKREKFNGTLDLPDASFDRIVTNDVIECIKDKRALIAEFHRVLKPGGTLLASHWDWDTMLYSVKSEDLARKAASAFAEWKQPWMDDCDGRMGRKLWELFQENGGFQGRPDSFNLIETSYEPGRYGFDRMQDIARINDEGKIGAVEHEKLRSELIERNRSGRYFFCVTSFIYYGQKV